MEILKNRKETENWLIKNSTSLQIRILLGIKLGLSDIEIAKELGINGTTIMNFHKQNRKEVLSNG